MKQKFIDYYMDVAKRTALLSTAEKLKVGAILVKNNNIIGFSYNGTPSGWSNVCENEEFSYDERETLYSNDWEYDTLSKKYFRLKTKPEVSHAEENLIIKLSKSHESSDGGVMFVTHNPCYICSRLIYGANIKSVYYEKEYRDSSGVDFLKECGIEVIKYVK